MTKYVSILSGGTNNHPVSAADFNYFATDFIIPGVTGSVTNSSGVAPMTGNFAVNAQSSPNTTTQVSPGVAYITATPTGSVSQTFRVLDTVGTTITHASNTSGATRYDYIYLQLDPAALLNPSTDGSSPLIYTVSRSSSNTTDNGTPPTYGINIAIVTLTNTFSSVTNGNISDKRVQSVINSIPGTNSYSYGNFYNPYKFGVYRNGTSSLSGVNNLIHFDTKLFDTSSNVDITTNIGRFTAPVAGYYDIDARVGIQEGASGSVDMEIQLWKNGVLHSRGEYQRGTTYPGLVYSNFVSLAVSDYLEIYLINNASSTAPIVPSADHTYFSGHLVSTT